MARFVRKLLSTPKRRRDWFFFARVPSTSYSRQIRILLRMGLSSCPLLGQLGGGQRERKGGKEGRSEGDSRGLGFGFVFIAAAAGYLSKRNAFLSRSLALDPLFYLFARVLLVLVKNVKACGLAGASEERPSMQERTGAVETRWEVGRVPLFFLVPRRPPPCFSLCRFYLSLAKTRTNKHPLL